MIKKILILLFLYTNIINAQNKCGTEEYINILKNRSLEYSNEKETVKNETNKWLIDNANYIQKNIITIPVVVHVIWNNNTENISDNQIYSQIDVLNNDYRRTNIDAINTPLVWSNIASDCMIEFCLATIDPNGNTTNGITRTQTSLTSFNMQDKMKYTSQGGIDAWPNDDYLNIWVCDLGNGLLGYATPPTNNLSNEDGVVVSYKYFGTTGTAQSPYHKGRTTTHEVGHWLNLEHVWGFGTCGNDGVNDTPIQEEENYGCPGFPHNTNSCNTNNQNGDMFMNYMDYTNDACMNMFTAGQKARMLAAINMYRSNMLNHNLCNITPPTPSWNCINGNCIDPGTGNGIYNDYNLCAYSCNCAGINLPVYEGFQNNTLATNWSVLNNDGDKTWEITNTVGFNSSSSLYINNADYSANGEYDDLILPVLDFTSFNNIYIEFDYAYSLWTNPNAAQNWSDTLQIFISTDCELTWQKIWEKSGLDLVTTNPTYNAFSWTPTNNNDWSSENIDLSNYINENDAVIKIRNINDFENNLFIDNININGNSTSIININKNNKKLINSIDILGRKANRKGGFIFNIYDDGTVKKIIMINR